MTKPSTAEASSGEIGLHSLHDQIWNPTQGQLHKRVFNYFISLEVVN